MPDKANRRKPTQRCGCPFCQRRLWNLGSHKYYLGTSDSWLEKFFCEEHGVVWMRLSKNLDEAISATAATSDDLHRLQDPRDRF
jgi:hypothetical protein